MNVNLVMRLMKYSYINGRVVFLFGFFFLCFFQVPVLFSVLTQITC